MTLSSVLFETTSPGKPARRLCGHALPSPHAVCSNCSLNACDECSDKWPVCASCSGGICEICAPYATRRTRSERVGGIIKTSLEYLCSGCAAQQAKARKSLELDLRSSISDMDNGVWLCDVVAELEEALAGAKEAL